MVVVEDKRSTESVADGRAKMRRRERKSKKLRRHNLEFPDVFGGCVGAGCVARRALGRLARELTSPVPIECDYVLADRWSKDARRVFDENEKLQVWRPDFDAGDVSFAGPVKPKPTPDPAEPPCIPDPEESQPLPASPLYDEERWHLGRGDCVERMDGMPPDSVDLVFGSPPYAEKGERYIGDAKEWKTDEWVDWMCKVTLSTLRGTKGYVLWVANGAVRQGRYLPACEMLMSRLHQQGVICDRPCIWYKNAPPNRRDYFGNDWEPVLAFKTSEKVPCFRWESVAEPPTVPGRGTFPPENREGGAPTG